MITDKFPILEFDGESRELIDVRKNINDGQQLPKNCVITFFGNVVKDFVRINHCERIGSLIMETFELDIYEYATKSKKIAFMHGLGSGPYAAGQIEKLSTMGCKKFIVCGGCGVLEKNSNVGDIYVPVSAVRDEGTSYHYVAPSREIDINPNVEFKICSYLDSQGIAYSYPFLYTLSLFTSRISLLPARNVPRISAPAACPWSPRCTRGRACPRRRCARSPLCSARTLRQTAAHDSGPC